MSYYDHAVMMRLQLGIWGDERRRDRRGVRPGEAGRGVHCPPPRLFHWF